MKRFIPYNPKLKPLARRLRQEMTFGEVLLWNELKQDKLHGFDFDRQVCLDEFIVDFYCKELMPQQSLGSSRVITITRPPAASN